MCDCTAQLNQISDRMTAVQGQLDALAKVFLQFHDTLASIENDTTKMADMVRQVETLFSEDNIMSMLSGMMGGGEMPSIGG